MDNQIVSAVLDIVGKHDARTEDSGAIDDSMTYLLYFLFQLEKIKMNYELSNHCKQFFSDGELNNKMDVYNLNEFRNIHGFLTMTANDQMEFLLIRHILIKNVKEDLFIAL